jgi:hypothetical protein
MRNLAALPAHHFSQHMIILNIDGISGDFRRRMTVADMPRHFQQAQGIIGFDLQQSLGSGFDQHQPPIIKFERISIIENGGFFQIEQKTRALFTGQNHTALVPPVMIKRHLINHPLDFNRRLAKNRC